MLRPRTGPEGELSPVASSTESHFVLIGQDTLGQRRLAGNARADGGVSRSRASDDGVSPDFPDGLRGLEHPVTRSPVR